MGKVIVVGTLAFDTIETPYGKVDRVIGGSAPFASLAAKTKNVECAVVSIVGNDFPKSYLDLLISKGIDISEVQIEKDGKSFFWSGKYHDNMNKRDTLETQVNVLANFNPKIPKNYTNLDILVLGNLDPKVQLSVISQFEKRPKFTMLDTMNFWMDNTLDNLLKIISKVDLICINDEEVIQLSGCKDYKNGIKKILTMGPKYLIMKKGEYGSTLYSDNLEFFCPSFKVKKVIDPTGAGDSFAGAFAGHLAESKNYTFESISSALIYANAVASFCVEKFGIENMLNISKDEIDKRISFIKKHNN
jgi:sugar/nucleoside kinase (ribokinase family)